MRKMHGYTYIEILTAFAIILLVGVVIAIFMNPAWQLRREYDVVREDAVRDYMEALLDLQLHDPDTFNPILESVSGERTMIGYGDSCVGDYGDACTDEVLSDTCVDLREQLALVSLEQLPYDPREQYSELYTGYYLSYIEGVLEVGACNPEAHKEITLTKRFDWE